MSGEKQIEEMAEIMRHSCEKDCKSNKYGKFDCEFCEAELLYNAGYRKQSGWISVEERLPEVAGREYMVWDDVQATVKKRYFHRIPPSIPIETYPHIREYFGNASDHKRYTHWMPLPEPPKGE